MIPTLDKFFSPLNFLNLSIFVSMFFFFDVLGVKVQNLLIGKPEKNERLLSWLIGFGIFIFTWFLASIIIPYKDINIVASIILLFLLSLPSYVKKGEYKILLSVLWSLKFPILVIVPFLPAVFVKSSLPPYYGDEMAYHFIAPSALFDIDSVKYVGGLYADLPRILNLFWELLFSLTKTYSIARLFHFTILATATLFAYAKLKMLFGRLTASLFFFGFFSLPQDIVLTSTLGYIDVGAYSFLLIGFIFILSFFFSSNLKDLYYSAAFWALNLGTKYTGISSFVVIATVASVIILVKHKDYLKRIDSKFLLKIFIIIFVFGGYWYIKNLILYGNPIFPFFFNCWGSHVEPCAQSGGFFGDWTTKVNIENANIILSQLFIRNKIIRYATLLPPLLLLLIKNKKTKTILLFIYISMLSELLFLKYFSGFYVRYHQHLQLYLLLGLSISLAAKLRSKNITILKNVMVFLVIASSLYFYIFNIKYTNSLNFLNGLEVRYAAGKIDIYDWIDAKYPNTKDVIRWCDGGKDRDFVNLARYDPDLIWFTNDGLTRVFMIRCRFVNPNIKTETIEEIIPSVIENKQQFWLTSINDCVPRELLKPRYEYERDYQFYLRKVDNEIVCNSEEVLPNLYFLDYSKI